MAIPDDTATMGYQSPVNDCGEASVVQVAISEGIETVGSDDYLGRRVARLNGLRVTG